MTVLGLVRRNVTHFWQINLVVVAGVAVAVAVLAGALLVGSSVRSSLRALALERLGSVDQVVTSLGFVRESLADELLTGDGMADRFGGAVPIVAIEGFVTHQDSGRRASVIQVYGVDERFWEFHGVDQRDQLLDQNTAFISEGLARELGARVDDALLVRVEKPSDVPISSLHGRRDDLGGTLRLGIKKVLSGDELGEFSFRPQQGLARAVFVSLTRLQQELEQDGRVNSILLGIREQDAWNGEDGDAPMRLATAESAVRATTTLDDLGLRVRALPDQNTFAVESVAGLIDDTTVSAVEVTAAVLELRVEPVLTYLANQLRVGDRLTPYSLVTALNLVLVSNADLGTDGDTPPVVLNRWAADDLHAAPGDTLTLEYYVWEDEGRLSTHETELRVADVVSIEGIADDRDLAPNYPGITEVNNVIDWDPPFDVDLSLIRPVDEAYWDVFRTTPKAFVSLDTGQQLWASRWGQLTSVRLFTEDSGDIESVRARFAANLRASIDPLTAGVVVYPARALALEASAGATDFGEYFVYFSFFLVVSALLLASLFFRLGIEQRLPEVGLLKAAGFPLASIRRVFWSEAFLLSVAGSLLGVIGAIAYAKFIMWGLSTWWVDAVGTTRLTLFLSVPMLGAGVTGGIVAAFITIAWTLRTLAPASARSLLSGAVAEVTGIPAAMAVSTPLMQTRAWTFALVLVTIGFTMVLLSTFGVIGVTAGFFCGGLLLLGAMLALAWAWLNIQPARNRSGPWSLSQIGFRNASYRPGRSVLCIALIASAAFIIVSVDAFRREGSEADLDPRSGTGGFTLLADTLIPIAHDPATDEGREALNLMDLYEDGPLAGVALTRFRVRTGEDASCLNLYQAKDPRVLAPTEEFVQAGRFAFSASMAETQAESDNPWLLLDRTFDDGAIPAIADATSLTYALHLSVGDDFVLNRDTDRPIRLRIVAALSDSIFQRELLIAERHFERVFPDYDGYRFFLIDAVPEYQAEVIAALEDRMADFGFDVVSAAERLAAFHRVENTYLATFQTLGGLGLVLGTFGLSAVLLRNVLERRRELGLLRAVGYNARHLSLMVLAENTFLLFTGLLAGTACAVVAIAPAWLERGGGVPLLSLGVLLLVVVTTGLTASLAATIAVVRAPLLHAIRTE